MKHNSRQFTNRVKPLVLSLSMIALTACNSGANNSSNSGNISTQAATASCFTITNASSATSGSQYWITTTATLKNTCSTPQSLTGTAIVIANSGANMNGSGFSFNSINPWSESNGMSFNNVNNSVVATITGGPILAAGATASVSFGGNPGLASAPAANSFTTAIGTNIVVSPTPTPTPAPSVQPSASPAPIPSPAPTTGTVVSSGDVFYHLAVVPVSSSAGLTTGIGDDINLAGDHYTDLILSNMVAGAMQTYLINKTYPGMGFNNDYMHGMVMGQLLQENLQTSAYLESTNQISPSSLVGVNQDSGVMGAGQGGPYQINSYAWDQVGGNVIQGYALINFVALQKNIGYTIANSSAQVGKPTPPSFNNKYYGPMLVAFWHYNDLRTLEQLAKTSQSAPAPTIDSCLANLKSSTNAPLDVPLGYAYNAGYLLGGLVSTSIAQCSSNISKFISVYNDYANSAGTSYNDYPYQVRFYLDELYGNAQGVAPNTHLAVNMTTLGNIFSNVMQTLAYVNANESYVNYTSAQAIAAYNKSLTQNSVSSSTIYDLSNNSQRATIFSVLKYAIANLEASTNSDFTKISLTQVGATTPTNVCPTNPQIYSASTTNYTTSSVVESNPAVKTYYQCTQPGWCNSGSTGAWAYAPGSGAYWSQAWTVYSCK